MAVVTTTGRSLSGNGCDTVETHCKCMVYCSVDRWEIHVVASFRLTPEMWRWR